MSRRLPELVARQADLRPQAVAVTMNQDRLTYGELEKWSTRLAQVLVEGGCRPGDRVGLLLPKSVEAIVSMLGVMKAGALYVPIDVGSPPQRAGAILATAEPSWILATGEASPLLDGLLFTNNGHLSYRIGWLGQGRPKMARFPIGFDHEDVARASDAPVALSGAQPEAAHLLFTSGSTGQPKGVVITHESVMAFLNWAVRYFGMGPDDRVANHAPLVFDLSTFDIYGTFASGAELHLLPAELNLLPHSLARFIESHELTQWLSVPSTLRYMASFDVVPEGGFRSLRRLLWAGDVLPTPVLRHWMRRLPHVTFTNLYGPTETTIASSYHTVSRCPTDDRTPIPIGTACEGEEILVLDEAQQPVAAGEIGCLHIRGVGVSPGYFRDPERTQAAFLTDAVSGGRLYRTGDLARWGEDGLLYFVGRADTQIKSRGYRIELGEVERATYGIRGLDECAIVSIRGSGFEGALICCAFVPAPGAKVGAGHLRQTLSRALPAYMLPARWLELSALPKTPNGKIDRRALMVRFEEREAPTSS